jgi:uncharacterized delta-60 repeat protein
VVVGGRGDVVALAMQRDGKIVVVANGDPNTGEGPSGLVRYTAKGGLDRSFGKGGVALRAFGIDSYTFDAMIQADGRIVSAGYGGPDYVFALARHLVDGRLDQTFGRGGKVLTGFGLGSLTDANALALQADGKIVAAGDHQGGARWSFVLARYMPNGKMDATFGSGGDVLTGFESGATLDASDVGFYFVGAYASDVAVEGDGRIVAAGSTAARPKHPSRFALARYLPDGRLDPGFGTAGKVLTGFGQKRYATLGAIAIQPDGKIIAVGSEGYGSFGRLALVRYTPAGRLDPSFGRGGMVVTSFGPKTSAGFSSASFSRPDDPPAGLALALQGDGKIVVAGTDSMLRSGAGEPEGFALARFLPSGRLDTSFGNGGRVLTRLDLTFGSAVMVEPDGSILVGGGKIVGRPIGVGERKIVLARYLPNGRLDPSFGAG